MKFVGAEMIPLVSTRRTEMALQIDVAFKSTYSEGSEISVLDPRSGLIRRHLFGPRQIVNLSSVILEPSQGVVYTSKGELVQESTSWPHQHYFMSFPWKPSPSKKYKTLQKSIPLSSTPFYHWLIEDLPTSIRLLEEFPDVPLVVSKNRPKFVDDFLTLSKANFVVATSPVLIKSLYMVEKCLDYGWPHPNDIGILLNYPAFKQLISHSGLRDRVYISRANSRRSPSNELQIENLFKSRGFVVLYLENMSLSEQISNISAAKILAGVHGAGLSHTIWQQSGSLLIDIYNETYWTECFHRLCASRDIAYESFGYAGSYDSSVPIDKLELRLDRLINEYK